MYKIPLAFALLFGVSDTGNILPPSKLKIELPTAKLLKLIDKDYVWNYEQLQEELNDGLSQTEDGFYIGIEGTIWYVFHAAGKCIQLKCKPEIIEAIHFSAGAGGLAKNVVLATCWNAFENTDTLTIDFIKKLLIEEFKPEIVEAKHDLIEKCMNFVTSEASFRNEVMEKYKGIGRNILLDKAGVMRELSQSFQKNQMTKVYSIIAGYI